MRIVKIVAENGYKLIAAENVINYRNPNCHFPKGYKHSGTGTVFFDYKDTVLRKFCGSRHDVVNVDCFKSAIKYIFSL